MHRAEYHMTLQEVSEEMGISRELVRRIEQQALQKLWFYCWWRDIRVEDHAPSDTGVTGSTEPLYRD